MGPCWDIPGLKVCIGGEREAGEGASLFPLEEAAGEAGNRQIVFLGEREVADGLGVSHRQPVRQDDEEEA